MLENQILLGDALEHLQQLPDDSIDLVVTDPPYGYSFMNKDWDKTVVSTEVWKECLRVLKAGAFAFIMSAPRQDVLSRMICNLQDAGFRTDFTSIYWTYASGFPKAANVSKLVDKRNGKGFNPEFREYLNKQRQKKGLTFQDINRYLGYSDKGGNFASDLLGDKLDNRYLFPSLQNYTKLKILLDLDNRFDELVEREEAEREIIGQNKKADLKNHVYFGDLEQAKIKGRTIGYGTFDITKSATEQAKRLDGSYAGFQPKPALEVILVVMKPLSEKTFVDQALKNGKGITWLDSCHIPFQNEHDKEVQRRNCEDHTSKQHMFFNSLQNPSFSKPDEKGRFPANLLVSDDSLNDGKIRKKSGRPNLVNKIYNVKGNVYGKYNDTTKYKNSCYLDDVNSYSRYFDLDAWYSAQFIITPKASSGERNKGLSDLEPTTVNDGRKTPIDNPFQRGETQRHNTHPTVKPLKLFSYLITMGSRPNDIILDPFIGSGTTAIAAHHLNRKFIGIEKNPEYYEIAQKRIKPYLVQQKLL